MRANKLFNIFFMVLNAGVAAFTPLTNLSLGSAACAGYFLCLVIIDFADTMGWPLD